MKRFMLALVLGSMLAGCATTTPVMLNATNSTIRAKSEPQGYYTLAQGKTGQALLSALHGIIYKHTDLGYNGAREVMFGKVDDYDNNDTVECVYTGREATRIDGTGAAKNANMNTEHTWPQSLGAEGSAKADLHHLFPTDIDTNGARSSYPFGDVAKTIKTFPTLDSTGESVLGTDAQGHQVFEPRDSHKGNVARALLYFYTCYSVGTRGSLNLKNFQLEKNVLVKWSKLDPVDQEEQDRNDRVFAAQGNRNPYIDHPEWVEAVGNL